MQLKFNSLNHTYSNPKKRDATYALKNINLNICDSGEFVAIVGHTGSGKSTLIYHTNGLLIPSSGSVESLGYVITNKKRKNPKLKFVRKNIGFVFQFPEYQLFEETVLKDIMFAPLNFGFSHDEALQSSLNAAHLLGITDKMLDKSPFELSSGEMRKVAIAGILSYNPKILVLDEPTRGLDPKSQVDIMDIFNQIHMRDGKSIIMVSHDMNLVYQYAKRIIVLDKGEIAYDGDKETLFESGLYKKYSLEKPDVLNAIDYLNEHTNLDLNYRHYTLSDLLKSLEGGNKNE